MICSQLEVCWDKEWETIRPTFMFYVITHNFLNYSFELQKLSLDNLYPIVYAYLIAEPLICV